MRTGHDFVKNIAEDQRNIFLSPSRLKPRDFEWLIPLGTATAYLVSSDQRNMTEHIKTNSLAQQRSSTFSKGALLSLAAVPTFLAWKGWRDGNNYAENSGILSARALADTLIEAELLKLIAGRERPPLNSNAGAFETGNRFNSSFPSVHAASAWAVASVISTRYPGWLTQLAAYGVASAVSLSRVTAGQHFPTDVVAGSALGFLIGRYVARQTDPLANVRLTDKPQREHAPASGASFVPVDSWVYQALDRLAAEGLIPTQISGLRPWTRSECLRQVREAESLLSEMNTNRDVRDTLAALHRELDIDADSGAVVLDSIYARSGYISGPVLHDSLDFGQTWRNDLGRPFGSGFNMIDGFTMHAEEGHFFAELQGEYQHAPGDPPYSLATRQLVSSVDYNPVQAAQPQVDTNRFRTIEGYVGVRFGDFEFSVGKQAMWWGPTYDAPLSFSANAEPLKSAKITTAQPFHLPGFLKYLGEMRTEFVIGKLGGQQYTWRPWFNAQKISFKLTENLEMGFTRWAIFWGAGHPITLDSFVRNFVSLSSQDGQAGVGVRDPGDRKAGFDFRYRIPGLRNWLTLYSDSYSDDDPSPLAAPRRAALSPGLYLTHVPGIPRLSLRTEMASTMPMAGDEGGWLNYINTQYHSGNTNYGYLIGNPVGRDARVNEGWATYHFSPRTTVEAGYRQSKGGTRFLPGGSTQSDATLKADFPLRHNWHASTFFQFERYDIPSIGVPQTNVSGWLQLAWEPKLPLVH
jgi:membrane-associated phospholipid phosphatase